ncbi:hypothetical protein [Streptomyces sp. KL116D]|uniref:hypothetical protein n=1 Tax=Streptomyces sp. KL116D TaxID=3045152 RepID=UPI003558F9E4
MDRDDSRPLTGDEPTESMTVADVMNHYNERAIGVIHGERYTFVSGYGVADPTPLPGGGSGERLVYLTDCYGDEIPGTLTPRTKKHLIRLRIVTND